MNKDGTPNGYGDFIFEYSQAERVAAGDMSAVWEFIEDNRKFLTNWARKFLRNRLSFLPNDMHGEFYKPEELINQIYVDFPFYKLESEKSLGTSIHCSFLGITCGGYRRSWRARWDNEISLETPVSVSQRSGEREAGDTIKDILPSREPIPSEVVERQEHVEELLRATSTKSGVYSSRTKQKATAVQRSGKYSLIKLRRKGRRVHFKTLSKKFFSGTRSRR